MSLGAAGATEPVSAVPAPTRSPPDGAAYPDAAVISGRLEALAAAHPDLARVLEIGRTRDGAPIEALVLAEGARALEDRTGLLLVGTLDGRRVVDAAVTLGIVERLLDEHLDALAPHLESSALVVLPTLVPRAADVLAGHAGPVRVQAGNGRPRDLDRDGRIDEDGPVDLDGDGRILWMRVPDADGEWVIDEHDPRAMRGPERAEGERGTHRLLIEGRDADGDGEHAEDGADGVTIDENFAHGWREHAGTAGLYPLSEPAARALVDFMLAHPGLVGVLDVGPHDTLVSKPKAAKDVQRGGWGGGFRAPLDGLLEEDVTSMVELGRRFAEALGDAEHDVEGDGPGDGSFLAWAYHQAGRWPAAVTPWAPPTKLDDPRCGPEAEEEGGDDDDDDDGADRIGAGAATDDAEDAAAGDAADDADAAADDAEDAADDADDAAAAAADDDDDPKPTSDASSPVPAAILAWLDARHGGTGFSPWTAFEHPELGAVEIGGLLPDTTINPPPQEVAEIASSLAPFVIAYLDALPTVVFEDVEVERRADGVYAIEASLVNVGVLPTATRLGADARVTRPIRVHLGLPDGAARLAGPRQSLVRRLDGAGGRETFRWIVAARPSQALILRAEADSVPDVSLEVVLP